MAKTDVLIISPNARADIFQKLGGELAAVEPPIWAALMSQALRAKGYGVELMDMEGEELSVGEAVKRIDKTDARLNVVVVYGQQPSASTQNMHAAGKLCSKIKEYSPDSRILLVGGHVSALPGRTLQEEQADFVCQGEGILTAAALLDAGTDKPDAWKKVPGLWYMEEGRARFSGSAPLIPRRKLAEEMPGMAFDLLPMQGYRAHNWHCFGQTGERKPYASLYTSLGCPFRCSFCCINAPFGKPCFRYWDPDFTIKEFDVLAEKYNVRNIKIADEMFVLKKEHFLKLCRLLRQRDYGFNIWAYARVDTVKKEYLEELKQAGVNWLALGIESASKYVRDGVSKGRFGMEEIKKTVEMIKSSGINIIGNYIFGLPDDDIDTMKQTLDFALDLKCEMANFYCAMAYPGSRLYETAVREGKKLPDSWIGYSQYSYETYPLESRYLTPGQVVSFRDMAWQKYFTDAGYLELVRSKFGDGTVEHITGMTQLTLRRKHARSTGGGAI